jgi:hypothetical protein
LSEADPFGVLVPAAHCSSSVAAYSNERSVAEVAPPSNTNELQAPLIAIVAISALHALSVYATTCASLHTPVGPVHVHAVQLRVSLGAPVPTACRSGKPAGHTCAPACSMHSAKLPAMVGMHEPPPGHALTLGVAPEHTRSFGVIGARVTVPLGGVQVPGEYATAAPDSFVLVSIAKVPPAPKTPGIRLHAFAAKGPDAVLHAAVVVPVEKSMEKLPLSQDPEVATEQEQPHVTGGNGASKTTAAVGYAPPHVADEPALFWYATSVHPGGIGWLVHVSPAPHEGPPASSTTGLPPSPLPPSAPLDCDPS